MNYSWISIWLSAQALADRSWIVIQLVGIVRHLLDGIRAAQKGRAAALVELEAMRVEKDERAARCRQIAKECAELNEARLAGIHALATEKDRTARRAAEIAQMRVFARRDDVDLADIRARNVRLATERNAARSDLARALRALSHPIACSCPDCLWASEAAGGKAIGEPADEWRAAAEARIVALTERAETAERQTEQAIRHGAKAVNGWTKTGKKLEEANARLSGVDQCSWCGDDAVGWEDRGHFVRLHVDNFDDKLLLPLCRTHFVREEPSADAIRTRVTTRATSCLSRRESADPLAIECRFCWSAAGVPCCLTPLSDTEASSGKPT